MHMCAVYPQYPFCVALTTICVLLFAHIYARADLSLEFAHLMVSFLFRSSFLSCILSVVVCWIPLRPARKTSSSHIERANNNNKNTHRARTVNRTAAARQRPTTTATNAFFTSTNIRPAYRRCSIATFPPIRFWCGSSFTMPAPSIFGYTAGGHWDAYGSTPPKTVLISSTAYFIATHAV